MGNPNQVNGAMGCRLHLKTSIMGAIARPAMVVVHGEEDGGRKPSVSDDGVSALMVGATDRPSCRERNKGYLAQKTTKF
jgi:hypothetical protein